MISLIYVSSSVKLMTNEELLDILEVSHRNNRGLDVTGILLYKGGNFMQVLEGPEEAVEKLYTTIAQDPRHKDVSVLVREKIQKRNFPNWEMAFQNLDDPEIQNHPAYSQFLHEEFTDSVYRENPKRAYIMLLSFKDNLR